MQCRALAIPRKGPGIGRQLQGADRRVALPNGRHQCKARLIVLIGAPGQAACSFRQLSTAGCSKAQLLRGSGKRIHPKAAADIIKINVAAVAQRRNHADGPAVPQLQTARLVTRIVGVPPAAVYGALRGNDPRRQSRCRYCRFESRPRRILAVQHPVDQRRCFGCSQGGIVLPPAGKVIIRQADRRQNAASLHIHHHSRPCAGFFALAFRLCGL